MGTIDSLPTPFLMIDLDVVDRNIARMQDYCDAHAIALRPHVKTHKMPALAALQVAAGARGITCQKLGEAELMADYGFDDILITFPLVGVGKAERLAELAGRVHVAVGADSEVAAEASSAAVAARGTTAGFLVDCDTGFGRTGVQTPEDATALAELVEELPNLEFRGLMTHPAAAGSGEWLREARRRIEQCGLEVDCVSGGGTLGAREIHKSGVFTELRVGTYVFGDRSLLEADAVELDDCALRIITTVVSRPTADRAVLDAGSKTLTSDLPPGRADMGYGLLVEYPNAALHNLSEEHATVDLLACDERPAVGDVVTVIPNHACGAVNLHDQVAFHRGGRDVEIGGVPARGLAR
jgi:D-serine deaminase-like pyridoxal phosphate-dependent protein